MQNTWDRFFIGSLSPITWNPRWQLMMVTSCDEWEEGADSITSFRRERPLRYALWMSNPMPHPEAIAFILASVWHSRVAEGLGCKWRYIHNSSELTHGPGLTLALIDFANIGKVEMERDGLEQGRRLYIYSSLYYIEGVLLGFLMLACEIPGYSYFDTHGKSLPLMTRFGWLAIEQLVTVLLLWFSLARHISLGWND